MSLAAEARNNVANGGLPIAAALLVNESLKSRGVNQRVSGNDPTAHAEMVCLRNAGRMHAKDYRNSILVTTLSPCDMCAGAILLYKIPIVVIGDGVNFRGPEDYLRSRGVELVHLHDEDCENMMREFIGKNPALWDEDIGLLPRD